MIHDFRVSDKIGPAGLTSGSNVHRFHINDTEVLIGCCGWPEAKAKYFSRFSAVELQATFYEPPSVALAAKWRALAPPSFRFCMKAWQLITHQTSSPTYRRLKSKLSPNELDLFGSFRPTEQVWLAWERTSAIAETLNARVILFQCPPSFLPDRRNLANFQSFFSRIERSSRLLAWEPRGQAWTNDLVRGLCSDLNLVHCVDPFERGPVHGCTGYWRLHGRGGYRHIYSDQELGDLQTMAARNAQSSHGELFIFFNNVFMKSDSARFQSLLRAEWAERCD